MDASSRTSIDWSAVSFGVIGSAILAFVVGLGESILSIAAWVSGSLRDVSTFVVDLGSSSGGVLEEGASVAAESWSSFAPSLGIAGFPVAVATAVATVVVLVVVVRRVR